MKKSAFVHLSSSPFILVFAYTASSKFLTISRFRDALRQAPLAGAYAEFIAWLVPSLEVMLVVLLLLPKTRRLGLYGSLVLLLAFTFYILYVLTLAQHVPCECGGIITGMNWQQHVAFNTVLIGLASGALFADRPKAKPLRKASRRTFFMHETGGTENL